MKPLVKKVVDKLRKKKLTIAVAESCTGGLLSSYLTLIPKVSEIYSLGLITYSNKSKNKLLKVSKRILTTHGAVSKQTCLSMLKNLSKLAKTDICVSNTGVAGPDGGTSKKPVGLVYTGIKIRKKIICKKLLIKNKNRHYIQKETVRKTLKLISSLIN